MVVFDGWIKVCSLGCAVLLLCSCGSSTQTRPVSGADSHRQDAPQPGMPKSLSRAEVVETVDAGLGALLSHFTLEPAFDQGAFSGYRVAAVFPEGYMKGVVKAGDVVLEANGRGVENPNDVYEGFESLRTAKELEILLQRDGERRQLRFPILDGSSKP